MNTTAEPKITIKDVRGQEYTFDRYIIGNALKIGAAGAQARGELGDKLGFIPDRVELTEILERKGRISSRDGASETTGTAKPTRA